jgi:hypothetical protein
MTRRTEPDEPSCCVCGCTQNDACEGGCSWVAADLCSACQASWEEAVRVVRRLRHPGNKDWPIARQTLEVARACRRVQDKRDAEIGV